MLFRKASHDQVMSNSDPNIQASLVQMHSSVSQNALRAAAALVKGHWLPLATQQLYASFQIPLNVIIFYLFFFFLLISTSNCINVKPQSPTENKYLNTLNIPNAFVLLNVHSGPSMHQCGRP